MSVSDSIGSIGVVLLLLAFFLQLKNIIRKEHKVYLLLNFFGATLACISSLLIEFYPFVVLEGVWALVSIIPVFNTKASKTT
jgi:uncharacterized protein with PQ loop repeat